MSAATITLKLPTSLAQKLSDVHQDSVLDILGRGLRQFKMERSLAQHNQGNLSFGAAGKLAEVSQDDLARYAYAQGIEPPFSDQTLQEELL